MALISKMAILKVVAVIKVSFLEPRKRQVKYQQDLFGQADTQMDVHLKSLWSYLSFLVIIVE